MYINKSFNAIQTETKTLTMHPKAVPAKEDAFASILSEKESKLKIQIRDFSKGKGDLAIVVYFNLDLKDVYYLYRCATSFHAPQGFSRTKIFGDPEENGEYKGLCPITKLNISKNEKGYNISIDNGYGKKMKNKNGGAYMKSGSAVYTKKSYMIISEQDFIKLFKDAYDYFQIKKELSLA